MKPVMLPPGRAKLATKPSPTGSEATGVGRDHVGLPRDQLFCELLDALSIGASQARAREVAMKNVQSYRAMDLICRQRAVFDPEHSWKHPGDTEKWEHLAYDEIAANFRECKITGLAELAPSGAAPVSDDVRRETIAAA